MIPLPTMLSHMLVAWTIEVDNAFELRMPHRTTVGRKRGDVQRGPWLVSFAMYVHCIRHLAAGGLALGELERRAGVLGPISGLDRWGYVAVSQAPRQSKRNADPNAAVVRPTIAGRQAQSVWARLPDEVDSKWKNRYGESSLRRLRNALMAVVAKLASELPDYLPAIRGSGDLLNLLPGDERLPARWRAARPPPSEPAPDPTSLPLYALLSKVLLAFALEGLVAQQRHLDLISDLEGRWATHFGREVLRTLRSSLEAIVVTSDLGNSPLAAAYGPPPGAWRADMPTPDTLPHYPMLLRGGGYPDGA